MGRTPRVRQGSRPPAAREDPPPKGPPGKFRIEKKVMSSDLYLTFSNVHTTSFMKRIRKSGISVKLNYFYISKHTFTLTFLFKGVSISVFTVLFLCA